MAAPVITYLVPWSFARHVFRPETADASKPFQRLSYARAVVGLIAIVVLSTAATGDGGYALLERLSNAIIGFAVSAAVATCVVALYAVLFPRLLDDGARRMARVVFLRSALPIVVPVLIVLALVYLSKNEPPSGILFLLAFPLYAWCALLMPFMFFYGLRWVFGVGDVNPDLGPLVSTLAAVTTFWLDGVLPSYDPRPEGLQTFLKVCALLSVTALSIVESTALSKGYGAAFKGVSALVGVSMVASMVILAQQTSDPESSGLMFRTAVWRVELVQLRAVNGGVRAEVTYRNEISATQNIGCPSATGGSALVFAGETVAMTDGRCARAVGTVTAVRPGATLKTWGFFPVTVPEGERFAIRWWTFGTTRSSFVMPS